MLPKILVINNATRSLKLLFNVSEDLIPLTLSVSFLPMEIFLNLLKKLNNDWRKLLGRLMVAILNYAVVKKGRFACLNLTQYSILVEK